MRDKLAGADLWYRYEDVHWASPVDEWGYSCGLGQITIELRSYEVLRRTAKGVWIRLYNGDARFVLSDARKKFACPTKEAAKQSFLARKKRQLSIYKARAEEVQRVLALAEGL